VSDTSFSIPPLPPASLEAGLGSLRARPTEGKGEAAAKDFESVLLHKLLEAMDRTVPRSGLFDSGISGQVRGMFWYYLAEELSSQGGLGLWRQLHEQVQERTGDGEGRPGPSVEQEL
jgi:Rod binding domain-containing protein